MSSAVMTFPPNSKKRLIVDTDVASYIFKWHPDYHGSQLIVSFMTVAEMRQGALVAGWGSRKRELLEAYLSEFRVLHSDSLLCLTWAEVRNESRRKGRPISVADAWIAATALVLSLPLVTNNPKDFRHLDGLQIISKASV